MSTLKYFDTLKNALDVYQFANANEEHLNEVVFPKVATQLLYGGFFLLNGKEKLYLREIEFYFINMDGSIQEDKLYRKDLPDDEWLEAGTLFPHNSGIDITFEDHEKHKFRASVLIRAFDLFNMDNTPIILDNGRSLSVYDILLSRSNIFDGVSIKWMDEWTEPRTKIKTQQRQGLKGAQAYRTWNFRRNENLFISLDKEVNKVYFSDKVMVKHDISQIYKEICDILDEYGIKHELLPHTKDIWCRDYMPVQMSPNRFVQYVYDPDYLDNDQYRNTKTSPDAVCDAIHLARSKSKLILDGGNIIRTPQGVIMTRKAYNSNKMSQKEFEDIFKQNFGVNKITWLNWDRREIYGHADGIVRYISADHVLMTNYSEIDKMSAISFRKALEQDGYKVEELHYSSNALPRSDDDLSWAYINFLQTSKVIIVPLLGIEKQDAEALKQIQDTYSGIDVKGVYALPLLKEDGGFNCFSWTVNEIIDR